MAIKIALAGNPNCGKTTMFNALTGANQYVGNWPGVTVEKKEGKLKSSKSGEEIIITDLPGVYSLSPYTLEEVVSRDYLVHEKPQAIINLVDATNIERNLYLTTQILEIGIPVVIALNMADLLAKSGDKIDVKKLSEIFGCEVVETSALKGTGLKEVVEKAIEAAKKNEWKNPAGIFSGSVENAIAKVEEAVGDAVDADQKRWFAIKLLEKDSKVIEQLHLPASAMAAVNTEVTRLEKETDDDTESIITDERYTYIGSVIDKAVKKSGKKLSTGKRAGGSAILIVCHTDSRAVSGRFPISGFISGCCQFPRQCIAAGLRSSVGIPCDHMVRVFDLQIGALSDIFSPLLDSYSACCRNNSQQAKYEHDKDKFVLEKLISSFFHVYHLGNILTRGGEVIHEIILFSGSIHLLSSFTPQFSRSQSPENNISTVPGTHSPALSPSHPPQPGRIRIRCRSPSMTPGSSRPQTKNESRTIKAPKNPGPHPRCNPYPRSETAAGYLRYRTGA